MIIKIKNIVFGVKAKGTPIGDHKLNDCKTTLPYGSLVPRPTYNDWCKEYNVSRLYAAYKEMK
jgi:hypothetical protein